jgi:hypothetical protein
MIYLLQITNRVMNTIGGFPDRDCYSGICPVGKFNFGFLGSRQTIGRRSRSIGTGLFSLEAQGSDVNPAPWAALAHAARD